MTVKTQSPIELQNECGCIVDERLLAKAMLWYADRPQCGKKSIFMHGRYPAVSIHGAKLHVHRLLLAHHYRNDITRLLVCHHKDGDRANAQLDNLELIPAATHGRLHNAGKTLSIEHRAKISAANRRRRGMKIKKRRHVPVDELAGCLADGLSVNAIAKHFNVDWSTAKSRICDFYENKELLET